MATCQAQVTSLRQEDMATEDLRHIMLTHYRKTEEQQEQRSTRTSEEIPASLFGQQVYRDGIVGPVPAFPDQMEQRITRYLQRDAPVIVVDAGLSGTATSAPRRHASPAELEWLLHHATVFGPIPATTSSGVPLNPIREK